MIAEGHILVVVGGGGGRGKQINILHKYIF